MFVSRCSNEVGPGLVRLNVRKTPIQLKLLLPRHQRQGIGWLEGRNWREKDVQAGECSNEPGRIGRPGRVVNNILRSNRS
jgi:hypothetical protein